MPSHTRRGQCIRVFGGARANHSHNGKHPSCSTSPWRGSTSRQTTRSCVRYTLLGPRRHFPGSRPGTGNPHMYNAPSTRTPQRSRGTLSQPTSQTRSIIIPNTQMRTFGWRYQRGKAHGRLSCKDRPSSGDLATKGGSLELRYWLAGAR